MNTGAAMQTLFSSFATGGSATGNSALIITELDQWTETPSMGMALPTICWNHDQGTESACQAL